MKRNKKKGFTLIELIVVIAILGILAAVAVPRLSGFQQSAKEKTDSNNARLIANAASIALSEEKWKITGAAGSLTLSCPTTGHTADVADLVTHGYLDATPSPKSLTGSFAISINATSGAISVKVGSTAFYGN